MRRAPRGAGDGDRHGADRTGRGTEPRPAPNACRLRSHRPARHAPSLVLLALVVAGCVGSNGALAPDGPGTDGAVPQAHAPTPVASASEPASSAPAGPTLPAGLETRSWFAALPDGQGQAGIGGRSGRLTLPPGEAPLAASDGRLASTADAPDGKGSVLRVREIASGRLLAEVSRPERLSSAAFAGDDVVIAGSEPEGQGLDPGVVAISLGDGSVRTLLEPTAVPGQELRALARTAMASPSGRVLVSALCSVDGCAFDLLDLAGGASRRLLEPVASFPSLLTDDVLIVVADPPAAIEAYDLGTGSLLWRRDGAEFQYAYAMADGRIVESCIDHRSAYTFTVSVIDPRTNEERVVLRRGAADGLTLWPELSNDEVAVIGTGGRLGDALAGRGAIHAALLPLSGANAALVPGALTLDP